MRLLLQRVQHASVSVEEEVQGSISRGILAFLGIHKNDNPEMTSKLVYKLLHLRLFPNAQDKMHFNIKEIKGEILLVSQFTLYGDCSLGRRPSFTQTAPPKYAKELYHKMIHEIQGELGSIQTGVFGEKMEVSLLNEGPVTFLLEE